MKKFLAALMAMVILLVATYFGARFQMKQKYEDEIETLQAVAVKCLSAVRKIKERDPKAGEGCEKALHTFGEKL